MGTPLPPNEPGTPCATCFGVGQPFGDALTPKFVFLHLSNFQPGQFWDPAYDQLLLSNHLLEQTLISCNFALIDSTFEYFILWRTVGNLILVRHALTSQAVFSAFGGSPCRLSYPDDNTTPAGVIAFGGDIHITWSTEGLD